MSQSTFSDQPPSPFQPPVAPPPRRTWTTILALVGVALVIPCLCCVGIGGLMGRGVYLAVTERENVQATLDRFMRHMASKEVDESYALFSARAQRQVPRDQIVQAVEGPAYAMYEGYERLTVTQINVATSANMDQNQPQGTVAYVVGTVMYSGGAQGTFRATLEREQDQWRLHVMNVTVPPGKLGKNPPTAPGTKGS